MISLVEQLVALFQVLGDLPTFVAQAPGTSALPDTGGGAYTGSVGNLISAAMQTSGLYAQSDLLKNFKDYLQALAALCYLCSFIGALLSVGVFGNYTKGLYFLVGPPLFMWMITTTGNVNGTQLQFGGRIVPNSVADQMRFLKKYVQNIDNGGTGANVSYFFIVFDNLVSSLVQGTVQTIIDTRNNDDLIWKARERVFAWLFMMTPDNSGFQKLVVLGMRGECSDVFRRLMELQKYRIDPQKRSVENDNLTPIGQRQRQQYEQEKAIPRFLLDPEIISLIDPDPQIQERFRAVKVSCEQVWGILRTVSIRFANQRTNAQAYLRSGGQDGVVDWDRTFREVLLAAQSEGGRPEEVLAVFLIKNAMRNTTNSSLTASMFNRVPFNAERHSGIYNRMAEVHTFGGQFKLEYFARSIPYIQGFLLYLLTMSFPFFAVFLVMPGRATTFIVWCSLWVWVKSWDVGFAMVGVARKIFWLFLKASPARYAPGNTTNQAFVASRLDWSRPETVFSLVSDNDPLATQNTYFTVISLLTCSVPLLTAHFCLGATNLYDAFKMNIDQTADRFAGSRRNQMLRVMRASPIEQLHDENRAAVERAGNVAGFNNTSQRPRGVSPPPR